MRQRPIRTVMGIALFLALALPGAAQSIQPVILEYTEKADGRFEVRNDTLVPMAIVLEPKSFSISEDGRGLYRPLDPEIHVKLSTTSFRLEPRQSYYVFYKATADRLPAWFTVYAGFSAIQPHEGMSVRVMLPHTVYLYQKKPITRDAVQVGQVSYQANAGAAAGIQSGTPAGTKTGSVDCELQNTGPALVRVQEVRVVAGKKSAVAAGFPLLPGASRHVSVDWTEDGRPEFLILRFPHFDLKKPLTVADP